jgi:hypothetical protein
MIIFTDRDRQMLNHVVDVIGDRMRHEDGYTEQDERTVTKLDKLAKSPTTSIVILADDVDAEARQMFQAIVQAELRAWVPGASQRLLYRAGRIVGIEQPNPAKGQPDCGPDVADHALINDWVAGLYLHRCSNCFRLFQL